MWRQRGEASATPIWVKIEAVSKQANDEAPLRRSRRRPTARRRPRSTRRRSTSIHPCQLAIADAISRSAVTPGAAGHRQTRRAAPVRARPDLCRPDAVQTRCCACGADLGVRQACSVRQATRSGATGWRTAASMVPRASWHSRSDGRPGHRQLTLARGVSQSPGELLPGMYVRARLTQGVNALMLVPHAAVSRTPRGEAQAMVVNADSKLRRASSRRSNRSAINGCHRGPGRRRPRHRRRPAEGEAGWRPVKAEEAGPAPAGSGARSGRGEVSKDQARFFIDRPIFAWVIAIVIMLPRTVHSDRAGVAVSGHRRRPPSHQRQLSRASRKTGGRLRHAGHRTEADRLITCST